MSSECIFCKIAAGALPATKVYEDEDTLAFMDINPVVRGHTLVIPKAHHDPITEVPPALLQKLILVVRKIARAQVRGLDADGLNVTQANGRVAGQLVPHVHFHVIPRFEKDGQTHHWTPGKYECPGDIEQFAAQIRSGMENNDRN